MLLHFKHGSADVVTNSWTVCQFKEPQYKELLILTYLWQQPGNETGLQAKAQRICLRMTLHEFNNRLYDESNRMWVNLGDVEVVDTKQ